MGYKQTKRDGDEDLTRCDMYCVCRSCLDGVRGVSLQAVRYKQTKRLLVNGRVESGSGPVLVSCIGSVNLH